MQLDDSTISPLEKPSSISFTSPPDYGEEATTVGEATEPPTYASSEKDTIPMADDDAPPTPTPTADVEKASPTSTSSDWFYPMCTINMTIVLVIFTIRYCMSHRAQDTDSFREALQAMNETVASLTTTNVSMNTGNETSQSSWSSSLVEYTTPMVDQTATASMGESFSSTTFATSMRTRTAQAADEVVIGM